MWMTYKVLYGTGDTPLDPNPTMYYDIMFHPDELTALRRANDSGGKAILAQTGRTLEELRLERTPYPGNGG